jgi:hypothetical protein
MLLEAGRQHIGWAEAAHELESIMGRDALNHAGYLNGRCAEASVLGRPGVVVEMDQCVTSPWLWRCGVTRPQEDMPASSELYAVCSDIMGGP